MRINISLAFAKSVAVLVCASAAAITFQIQSQESPPLFSTEERGAILSYWKKSAKYNVTVPADATRNGLWQVRLTPQGSKWLWDYDRARGLEKRNPGQIAPPRSPEEQQWDLWIENLTGYEIQQAIRICRELNQRLIGQAIPAEDPRDLPLPGPVPPGIMKLVGNPPPLVSPACPLQHTIIFADGTKVNYVDNVKLPIFYRYYRFPQGVQYNGVGVRNMPKLELNKLFEDAGLTTSEAKVLSAVSILEGGFESVNTYDTGFLSVGVIQFATLSTGAGSLGENLQRYKTDFPEDFSVNMRRYGIDVAPDNSIVCIDLTTGSELKGPSAVQAIIEDKRLTSVFQRAATASRSYRIAQIRSAKEKFYPADDNIILNVDGTMIPGKVKDFIKTEAGMATLMDRKVNTGKIDALQAFVDTLVLTKGVRNFADLIPFEYDIIVALKYRKDYLMDASLSKPSKPRN